MTGSRRLPAITSPHQANELGIAVVHQEAPLIDTMQIAECMALFRGYPMAGKSRIDWPELYRNSAEMLERFDVRVDPRRLAGSLAPAERALVALVMALDRVRAGLELLILDEVTASLPEDQAASYLTRIGEIAQSGIGVLMVTHRLPELHGLANQVTILRDGHLVYSAQAGEAGDETLVGHMVGRGHDSAVPRIVTAAGTVRRLWETAGRTGSPEPKRP